MTLLDLPAELWTLVIKQLEEDGAQRAIAALSETCRLCHQLLQPILFSKPELNSPRSWHRYAAVWKQRINPFTLAAGRVDMPETMKPVEFSFGVHAPPAGQPSESQSRRVSDCLRGPLRRGLFANLTSLNLKTYRVEESLLAELLGPPSPLRGHLKNLELVNAGVTDDVLQFILEMLHYGGVLVATPDQLLEYQEDDEEVQDFPRDETGQPTADFSALAMRNFAAFQRLFCWVPEHEGINMMRTLVFAPRSSFPFSNLTSLDLALDNFLDTLEIPVIFGSPSFVALKQLKISSRELSYSDWDMFCEAYYAFMLRSVAPDFTKIRKPSVRYHDLSPHAPPPAPDSHPKWDSLDGPWHNRATGPLLGHYRGPLLDVLDLSEITMVWTGTW